MILDWLLTSKHIHDSPCLSCISEVWFLSKRVMFNSHHIRSIGLSFQVWSGQAASLLLWSLQAHHWCWSPVAFFKKMRSFVGMRSSCLRIFYVRRINCKWSKRGSSCYSVWSWTALRKTISSFANVCFVTTSAKPGDDSIVILFKDLPDLVLFHCG